MLQVHCSPSCNGIKEEEDTKYLKFFTEEDLSRRSPLLRETVFQQLSKVSESQNKTKAIEKYIICPTKMTH
jgi:hypothetical protein